MNLSNSVLGEIPPIIIENLISGLPCNDNVLFSSCIVPYTLKEVIKNDLILDRNTNEYLDYILKVMCDLVPFKNP